MDREKRNCTSFVGNLFIPLASCATRLQPAGGWCLRSGESTEVLLALEAVRALPGWAIAGITCYENSPIAQLAECLVSPLGGYDSALIKGTKH